MGLNFGKKIDMRKILILTLFITTTSHAYISPTTPMRNPPPDRVVEQIIKQVRNKNNKTETGEQTKKVTEQQKPEPEKTEPEIIKPVKPKKMLQVTEKKQIPEPVEKIITVPRKKTGININLSLGTFSPITDYGEIYTTAFNVSAGASLPMFRFYGFEPLINMRYSQLESQTETPGSELELFQISAGVIWPYKTGLPGFLSKYSFFKNEVTVYAGITEGLTRTEFSSNMNPGKISEYINTIEIITGLSYPVYESIYAGIDIAYRYVSTKDTPLQGFLFQFSMIFKI